MRDCVREVRLSSEMPDHARDAHGNLAEQTRTVVPVPRDKRADAAAKPTVSASRAELAKAAGCTACHGLSQRVVGPAFREIGGRYAGDGAAVDRLALRVRAGGSGAWGSIPMPAQPQVSDADAKALVRWILEGAK